MKQFSKVKRALETRRAGRHEWARLERVIAGQPSAAQQADVEPGTSPRLEDTAETRYLLAAQLAQTV